MRRERTNQTFKLRLLAFVLALALLCYCFNPAPRPVIRKKREDVPPDEKRRNIEPQRLPITSPGVFKPSGDVAETLSSDDEEEDDFEWPEFIDG